MTAKQIVVEKLNAAANQLRARAGYAGMDSGAAFATGRADDGLRFEADESEIWKAVSIIEKLIAETAGTQ